MTFSAACCSLIVVIAIADALSPHPVVVVLSFDGYRTEYISWPQAEYMNSVLDSYTGPYYLVTEFPTKTHVNHFTLATGLHAEEHGVINDCVFDREGEASENTYEQYHDDKDHTLNVVPIWRENENQGGGRRSAIMMWPGADFAFQGKTVTYSEDYSKYYSPASHGSFMDYDERMKKIFEWIEDEKEPANLVMAYFGELNKSIHFNGADSDATKQEIIRVDSFVKKFIEQMIEKGMEDKIHVIIIGGHGRNDVKYNGIIKLHEYLDDEYQNYITMGANALVNPRPDDFKTVYDNLKRAANQSKSFDVYKQDEIPDRWHLRKSPSLEGKILLVARRHYCFWSNHEFSILRNKGEKNFRVGTDGFDNTESTMHTFLAGIGPRFKTKYTGPPFNMIDVHPLLKHLLGLTNRTSDDVRLTSQMTKFVRQILRR